MDPNMMHGQSGGVMPQGAPDGRTEMGTSGPRAEAPPDLYQPNEQVKQILWQRIDFITPEELEMLDSMVTVQNLPLWMKLFPELAELLAEASAFDQVMGMSQEDIMGQGGAMPAAAPMQQPMGTGLSGQRFEG